MHFGERAGGELVADVCKYLDRCIQKRYLIRSMPYCRGYLFYGPPGAGKSSRPSPLPASLGSTCTRSASQRGQRHRPRANFAVCAAALPLATGGHRCRLAGACFFFLSSLSGCRREAEPWGYWPWPSRKPLVSREWRAGWPRRGRQTTGLSSLGRNAQLDAIFRLNELFPVRPPCTPA